MVMWPLCNTIVMPYIYYEQIDPYYIHGNVFGYTIKEGTRIWRFFGFPAFAAHVALRCPTFEINGHGASVGYYYDGVHIL